MTLFLHLEQEYVWPRDCSSCHREYYLSEQRGLIQQTKKTGKDLLLEHFMAKWVQLFWETEACIQIYTPNQAEGILNISPQ